MSKKLLLIVALLLSNMNFAFAAEVNLNSATQQQLESILPGDANTKKLDAQEIIKKRNEKRFDSIDDFTNRLPFKSKIIQQLKDNGAVVK